jgi:hypothetical protein
MSTVVWRFFMGEDQRWRWQTLTPGRVVLSESDASYPAYDACITAARAEGYLFQDAQANMPWHGATHRSMPGQNINHRR